MDEDTNTLIKTAAIDIMILTSVWGIVNLNFAYYNARINYIGSRPFILPILCLGQMLLGASISAYFIAAYI